MQILKKITMLAFLLSAFAVGAMAQLTGTKNIPGDYATVALAVTDLNTNGVGAGGVTFVVADSFTETAPAGGYTITNPTGNGAGNPIVFRRATSTGTRPAFTANAALTAGSLTDAIFKIVGTDNLTIDGFSMLENPANTTTAAATNNMTEFGVALFYATTTNGSQNVTVQNCIITLSRTYQNTFGVYSNSTHSATTVTTTATATTTDGGNSGLKLYSNSISNVNIGIVVVGPTAVADFNEGLDIGGTAAATGNSVTNYGTTGTFSGYANVSGTVNGVLVRFTRNYNVSFNSIVSSDGGTTAGTLRGIYVPTFTTAPTGTLTNSINNNNITVRSGVLAGTLQGIVVEATTGSTTSTLNINNNDFSNSGHTIAASGTITFISNAAVVQNENINTNTFTNMSVNTTGSVTFITNTTTNPNATGIKNVNGNSIVTAFAKTGAGGTVTLFTDDGSDVAGAINNSNNNNFSNITVTGATTILGLSNTNGGSPTKTVTGNTLTNWMGGTGATTAMVVSFSGAATVSNNTVNTISGGGSVTGISTASGGSVAADNFSQNTVHTLSGTGTGVVTGILNSSGTTRNIFRNRIYNLSNSNAGGGASGITVSGGTTINLYNNLVGDIRTPALNAANSLFGINISGGTTVNASFNTVYLNATSTGALFGSSALNASSTPTVTLRNNILVNTSTAAGATGFTVAYRRSSTTLTSYGSASNNNDFFAGTPSATNLIFYDGTNSDQTLGAYRSRVTPRDSASVSENPNFISTTGSNADFLHISTATPTQLESGGVPVTGITDDFDGQTRNASTPDIGADEFTGTAIDLNPPVISYTAVNNTTSTTNRVITATITDPSGVATGANSPRIYFRKNGGAYFSTQCAGSAPTYTCTIDYTLVGGIVANDVIDYFIVAQDTNGNVGANPSSGFAATSVNNVTSPPTTPNTYTVVAGFPTSVNVGATETTTSLTNTGGVFAALNAAVLTGNVTINITSDLTAETGTVALNQLNEEGAGGYTVTIQSSGATARTISGSNATALINLNGADRIIFNGAAFGANGLTIRNTSATTGAVVQMLNDASNNTITSCVIEGGNTNASSALILLGAGTTTGNDNNAITNSIVRDRTDAAGVPANLIASLNGSATARNSNNTVTGNQLINFTANGFATSGGATSENWTINGNDISQTATRAAGIFGINTGGMAGTNTISGNSIHGFVSSGTSPILGFLVGNSLNTTISRNRVYDFQTTAAATGLIEGLEFDGASGSTTSVTVVNNMISLAPTLATAQSIIGIQDFSFGGNVFTADFNSVYVGGTATGAASSWAMRRGTAAPTTYTARNNIAFNNRTGGTGNHFADGDQSANTGTFVSNYNLFVGTGATPANFMDYGTSSTGTPVSFAVWQAGPPTRDANSLASVAGVGDYTAANIFVSTATELRLNTSGNNPAIGAGIPITGITTDFDGQTRDTPPDIGADEIVSFVAPTVQFSGATYMGAEGTSATVTVTRTGDTTAASTVNYATSDGTATGGAACGTAGVDYQPASGSLSFAAGEMNKMFSVVICSDALVKGNETVNLTLSTPTGATLGTPATAVLTITNVNPPMPGTLALSAATYSVGEAGGTTTITVNRTGGTDGAVTVNYALADGTATGGAACGGTVDYVNAGGTVSFATGEAVKTFTVAICNDTLLEGNETFNVTLSGATGGAVIGTPATAVVTILDDEVAQPGILQFNPATYSVGEAGGTVALTVTRTGGTDGAVGASYSLANGTATGGASCAAGVDFVNAGGTVSFAAGEASKTITVTICNDTLLEGNEAFTATLASATGGATLGAATTATVTIVDDEVAQPGALALSSATYTVAENVSGGTLTVTVNRTGGTDGAVGATYALTNGTATGGATCATGVDFVNTGGTVSFANGVSTQTFTVAICNDTVFEGNETFNVTLSAATGGATIGTPATAMVTITDDEVAQNGTVSFSAATYTVTEAGPTATITINRTGGSDGSITVNYATVTGGTATGAAACAAGVDYVNTSGTATFGAGVTTPQTFTIPICNDTVVESSETVNLALTGPTGGATLGTPNTAVLTITDDDVAGLSGSYNVGTGQIYTSLTNTGGAFDALNMAGATGNITFNITSDLTAETGTVALNEVAGGFTVTIKPTGAARTISGSSTSGIIKLNGADFVTIDGSLTGGTATGIGGDPTLRNLTIQNTSTTATAGSVITVSSTATTNIGAHDNTIKNVNVSGQDATMTLVGISLGGQNPGSAGTDNDNNRVENCSVQKAILGIYNVGASAANQNTGNVITRNDLSATGTSRLRRAGVFVFNQDGIQITENSIGGIVDDESADAIGIIVGLQNVTTTTVTSGNVTNALVSRNRINGIASSSTVGFSAAGIAVAGGTTGANTIANNFITGVNAPSTSPDLVAGIFVAGVPSSITRLYYNSVSLTGDRGTVASQIGSYGVAITGTDPVVELKDNIFYTTQTSGGGTAAKSYAIGLNSTAFTNFNSNYNDYYSSGANAGFFRTGGLSTTGTDYANLAAFRAATGSDANSKEVDPLFVDPLTNLHLQNASPVLDMGTPVAGITVDYDGETRSATTPDIGADEVATVAQSGTLALSAATYTVAENVSGGNLTVTVNRTGGTDGAVSATYALTNGTATGGAACAAGVDYINTGGTVSFIGGQASQTFTVAICNDTLLEGNETFNVTLSSATGGATLGTPSSAVVTIADDEVAQPGTLALSAATYSVGEAGGTVTITVNRTVGTDGAVGATYALTNGTAIGGATCAAGVDFINTGGTVSFATGEAVKTFTVAICNDTLLEGNETFNVTLSGATGGATIGTPATAVVTILDDEVAQPGTLALSAATYTVSEAAASVTITVNRTGGTDGAVSATYALTNGTATGGATCTAGIDYINTGGTVSFASGAATQTFTVTLCPDALNKVDETFNVTLSNATGGATIGTPATAVVTITNDDPTPTISINSVSANEGNSGTTPFAFTVTLSAASGQTVTVNYFTADGTASAGSDYTATPNTLLTFAPGETTKTVTVLVNGDTVVEPDETFTVNLATPTNATIATAQGIGTIVNDDTAAVGSYSINDVRVVEGDNGVVFAVFTVTLANPNGQPSSVQYATANGTATAGSDYNAISGTLNFAANEITKTISVTVIGDTVKEAYETFFVNLSNPVGATISDNQGLGIIVDDDRAITADFDNDNKTDISVFRPSNGYWYVLQSGNNTPTATLFGVSTDLPVPGDYDGDGKVDVAVFRPSNGTWYILRSSDNGFVQTQFGFGNDKPVQGDYDGDGKTDIAVWRASNGTWYILNSSNGQFRGAAFGASGDVPVQGDYDGDTRTDLAVYRSGVWYVFNSATSAVTALQFGAATDKALVGDFDGDGKSDYTVYRSGVWYIFQSLTNTSRAVTFGAATDIPTVGDYDGDGIADVAVFRPSNGTWYILGSRIGFTATPFGQSGDIPIPTGYQSLQ